MNCVEFRQQLSERIHAGNPSAALEAPAFDEHRRQCAACARRYQAAVALHRSPAQSSVLPPQLVAQTLQRICQAAQGPSPTVSRRIAHGAGRRTVAVSGWLAAAAMAARALWLALAPRSGAHSPDAVVVRFELVAPQARQVAVVGDWNDWDPEAHAMQRRNGVWELTLPLSRGGEYRYQFLIDETQWVPDPEAPIQIEDGFGGINSLLDT